MKHAIIRDKLPLYLRAGKKEKGIILNNVQLVTGMPAKSLIRSFAREQKHSSKDPPKKRGRKPYYTAETTAALGFVWEQYDYPRAERLRGTIGEAIRIFVRDGMWHYSEQATELTHLHL